jgi:hypothetical protein
MKKLIKSLIPPLFWDKFQYARSYNNFLQYKDLVAINTELKDKHKGERCFILGSGPSIKKENLKPLKDEIVFALNNFYVHDDFAQIMSGGVKKYYMTAPIHLPQSEEEWKSWFKDMESYMPKNANMLFGLNNYHGNIKNIFEKYEIFKEYKINWYFAGVNYNENNFNHKAMDATNPVYNGESVSIYALILAIYMGFDEIYLLGMDHDYFLYEDQSQMRMYSSAKHQKNEFERMYCGEKDQKNESKRSLGNTFYVNEFLRQYNIFSKYKAFDDNTKSKIFNASNGGVLKVFQKVKFKDLFKK